MNGTKEWLTTSTEKRKTLQGAINILDFNRHFYVAGFTAMAILFVIGWFYIPHGILYALETAILLGMFIPLLISAWVYDLNHYYELNWLKDLLSQQSGLAVASLNAGFDETSYRIKELFPNADLQVFDFYNAQQHTEPSIKRAREKCLVYPNTKVIESPFLPLENESLDDILFLSSLHEIRNTNERLLMLKECKRVLKPNGKIIIVEHLRDVPNFLAFSIGFFHFFSRNSWLNSFKQAGFNQIKERKFTAFLSIFIITKS